MNYSVEEPIVGFNAGKLFGTFSTLKPKSFTSLKKIVQFASDEESAINANEVLEHLKKVKESLPIEESEVNVEKLHKYIEVSNKNLASLNSFTEFIDQMFDSDEDGAKEIVIDDDNMKTILEMVEKAKTSLLYILDYSKLVLSVHETKETLKNEGNVFSIDEFITAVKCEQLAA